MWPAESARDEPSRSDRELTGLVPFSDQRWVKNRSIEVFGENGEHLIDPCCRRGEDGLELMFVGGFADLAREGQVISNEVISVDADHAERGVVQEVENPVQLAFDPPKLTGKKILQRKALSSCLPDEFSGRTFGRCAEINDGKALRRIEAPSKSPCTLTAQGIAEGLCLAPKPHN